MTQDSFSQCSPGNPDRHFGLATTRYLPLVIHDFFFPRVSCLLQGKFNYHPNDQFGWNNESRFILRSRFTTKMSFHSVWDKMINNQLYKTLLKWLRFHDISNGNCVKFIFLFKVGNFLHHTKSIKGQISSHFLPPLSKHVKSIVYSTFSKKFNRVFYKIQRAIEWLVRGIYT